MQNKNNTHNSQLPHFNSSLLINTLIGHLKNNKNIENGVNYLTSQNRLTDKIIETIPLLLKKISIDIEPFKNTCYSVIITQPEVEFLKNGLLKCCDINFESISTNQAEIQKLLYQIVYSIPYIYKQAGCQLIKNNEKKFVNEPLAEQLARAIHSNYRLLMTKTMLQPDNVFEQMYLATASKQYIESDFENLPPDIRQSNIDNAYHIPTKLLSIGLKLQKTKTGSQTPILYLSGSDIETMAKVEHERWCWEKRMNGFIYGPIRNDEKKIHNCLINYNELTEFEKEKDRQLVKLIPVLLHDIGYSTTPVDNAVIFKLGYITNAETKIAGVKLAAEQLNNSLENYFSVNQLQMPANIAQNIDLIVDGTAQIAGAFSSAVSVQRTFLPSPLQVRECLPDSFLLYKPKDGVAGDFYFVAKKFGAVIWVCADCTGHGISAALLSAICYNYIDQAVNQQSITDPAAIIANVMPKVEYLMHRSDGNLENKSGMELAVCTFYPQSNILFYSGLNRPLYHVTNGQLNEIDAVRYKESFEEIAPRLKTQIIQVKPNDTVYLTSDGFIDQFGGSRDKLGERFKNKRFKELLIQIQDKDMAQQREAMNQVIEQWRQQANQDQTDDVLVIGVKF